MRGYKDALAYALLRSTNPSQLERACYMLWIHLLVTRSNLVETGHLWTSSEFAVGATRTVYRDILAKLLGDAHERELRAPASNDQGSHSALGMDFYESPVHHARKRRREPAQTPPVSPTRNGSSLPEYAHSPSTPDSPWAAQAAMTEAPPSSNTAESVSTKATPARSERDEKLPDEEELEKLYRTRIVDFAVSYLSPDLKESIEVHDFCIHEFEHIHVPIVVEGKRAPPREEPKETLLDELQALLSLAQKDIHKKRDYFFKVYRCKSFVGIAFSGPYWVFSICHSDSLELEWSKPISIHSDLHDSILTEIFKAAENSPEHPGGHRNLQDLLERLRLEPGCPFEFAALT